MEKPPKAIGILASEGPYKDTFVGYVYKITNKVNGMIYIGLTTRIPSQRWAEHLSNAKEADKYRFEPKNKRDYSKLYQAMAGNLDKFIFEVLVTVPIELLGQTEEMFIKHYDSMNKGYNLQSGGYRPKEVSNMTKGKLSLAVNIALAVNPDKDRKHPESKGLPTYLNYRVIENQPCYVVEHHPKCNYKSFKIIDYESNAIARETAIAFVEEIEKPESTFKTKTEIKAEAGYPIGIRPARTHNGRALSVSRGYWDNRQNKTVYMRRTVYDSLYTKEDAIAEAIKVLAEMDQLIKRIQNGEDIQQTPYTPNRK